MGGLGVFATGTKLCMRSESEARAAVSLAHSAKCRARCCHVAARSELAERHGHGFGHAFWTGLSSLSTYNYNDKAPRSAHAA